jgi:hypothetical protein
MVRTRIYALVAAGAIAAGATILTTAPANAESEKQIQSECEGANGTYATKVGEDGHRYSHCGFTNGDGILQVDSYTDGTYTGSDPPEEAASGKPGPPRLAPNHGLSPVAPPSTSTPGPPPPAPNREMSPQ